MIPNEIHEVARGLEHLAELATLPETKAFIAGAVAALEVLADT